MGTRTTCQIGTLLWSGAVLSYGGGKVQEDEE